MSDEPVDRREFVEKCSTAGATLGLASLGAGGILDSVARAPLQKVGNVSNRVADYWHVKEGKTTICDLCPSLCEIQPGERGTCGVRENEDGYYVTKIYARPCEIRSDPMEKGPFFHLLPDTQSLAMGFAGCNLDCKYCQSASFAKARPEVTDNKTLSPKGLVSQLLEHGYKSITFTFSEPMQAIEYVLDVAKLARPTPIKVLVHTSAHFLTKPFEDMCSLIDGINIDLKGFTETFYKRVTGGSLEPVLNNIARVRRYSHLWLELTNLVVPGYNDDKDDFRKMSRWIAHNCGIDTPLHVSRFFPQYKFRNVPATSEETLRDLRKIAYQVGLRYVYLGNMPGDPGTSTYCPKCGVRVIHRLGYDVKFNEFNPETGVCERCGLQIPGVWA